MNIRFAAAVLLLTPFALAQTSTSKPVPKHPAPSASNWKQVHESAIVIDTHADTPGRFVDENFDPSQDAGPHGHWDLARAKAGNLGAEFFSIWVDPDQYKGHYTHRALDMIDSVHETVRTHPDQLVMASTAADIRRARTGPHKRIAILMGIEGGHAIEGDVRILRDFYRLGARYMTLTWANSNELGQSSGDYKTDPSGKLIDPGLTDFGRSVVKEMNRLGMMVDISHVSDRTFYDTLTVSRAPVIASHSSARAITDVPRNMTDDMLTQLARYNGGVVQVNFNCGFISNDYNVALKKYQDAHPEKFKEYNDLELKVASTHDHALQQQLDALTDEIDRNVPRPPLSALIDHIDHIAKVAGVDHVGIGSDFDGVPCLPQGIDSVADLSKVTQALMQRGYTAQDMKKILGGNLLRVMEQVEKVSHEMQNESPDKRREMKIPAPTK